MNPRVCPSLPSPSPKPWSCVHETVYGCMFIQSHQSVLPPSNSCAHTCVPLGTTSTMPHLGGHPGQKVYMFHYMYFCLHDSPYLPHPLSLLHANMGTTVQPYVCPATPHLFNLLGQKMNMH